MLKQTEPTIQQLVDNQTVLKIPIQFIRLSTHQSMCKVYDHINEKGGTRFQLPRALDIIQGFELEPDNESHIDRIRILWRGQEFSLVKDGTSFTLPGDNNSIATWDLCLEYIVVIAEGRIGSETKLNLVGKFVDRSTFCPDPCRHLFGLFKQYGHFGHSD